MKYRDKRVAILYLITTFCIWGSLYVVSKVVLGKVPVFIVLFFRYMLATFTLFIILRGKLVTKIKAEDYKHIFHIGFFGYFISVGLQFLGTKFSNASLSSLINSMNPITIAIFAGFLLNEKIGIKKAISIIIALLGVYIIMGGVEGKEYIIGGLFAILAVILWSFVSVKIKILSQKYDSLHITIYGMLVGGTCTLPLAVYQFFSVPDITFSISVAIAITYMGIVCTALAHAMWNKSLSLIDASICSMFYPLQPMVAMLLGWIFLNEEITRNFMFGAILIISGILFNFLRFDNVILLKRVSK